MEELQKETKKIIDDILGRWCPVQGEELPIRMMRALLQLNAFELDYKRVLAGEQPIRTDYPLPLPKVG